MLIVSWFARAYRGWTASAAASAQQGTRDAAAGDVAFGLLESADGLAGFDPNEAHHLRIAARAWLSVVR